MSNVMAVAAEKAHKLVSIFNRRRWLSIVTLSVLAPVLAVIVSLVPNRYEAKARVYVDTQTVLKPMMAGLTFEPDVDQQVRMLALTLISRPNMQRLLKEVPDLTLDDDTVTQHEELVSRLMSKIRVVSAGADNLYEISYRGNSPAQSLRLVEATVDLFVRSGIVAKKRDSEDAGHFIEDQIQHYEKKLVEAENRLKDFKIRNFGATGVSAQDYFTRISLLSEEVDKLHTQLEAVEKARESYRRALDTELLQAAAGGSFSVAVSEIENRLETQNKQLDDYLHRFTEQHPDVVNARRVIAELKLELSRRKDAELRGQPVQGSDKRNTANPVYQKLKISLAETEAQAASLRAQLTTKQASLEQVRAVGDRMPQIEAELAQLNRDYDVIRKNYEIMVARREAAQLGLKLNESSQLADFRVIEPPKASNSPVFPSRLHLALIAMLAAIIVSLCAPMAINYLKPTVDSASALQQLSGRPVLGTVSMQVGPQALSQQRKDFAKFKSSIAMIILLQVIWVGWVALQQ